MFKDLVAHEEQLSPVNGSGDGGIKATGSADSEPNAAAVRANGPNVAAVGDPQKSV